MDIRSEVNKGDISLLEIEDLHKITYLADGTLHSGDIKQSLTESGLCPDIDVKDEIVRLSSKVRILENQITELRASLPTKCPKCNKYSEPVLKSYYDLNYNSKINGIKKIYKLCPCCNFIYMEYDE